VGTLSTELPVTQNRDANDYNWNNRHEELLKMNREDPPEVCFFGNSITHFWGGKPAAEKVNGPKSWKKYFGKMNIRNFGFGWDRVENVLWRVYHDELDGYKAKQIILMIGTNNISIHDSDEKIAEGIRFLIGAMKTRQPDAKFLLLGIYPGKGREERVKELNLRLSQVAELEQVDYADIGDVLLNEDGKIKEELFVDGLHPNEKGYDLLGAEIIKALEK
jgi:lysophospholipase L1-like esterase